MNTKNSYDHEKRADDFLQTTEKRSSKITIRERIVKKNTVKAFLDYCKSIILYVQQNVSILFLQERLFYVFSIV